MSQKIVELMRQNLNKNGKLDCKCAFKIASKTKTPIREVGSIAHDNKIRIDNCDLGQFGKLDKGESTQKAKEKLTPFLDERKRIFCKDGREAAKGIGLKKIRGTLQRERIDVKYCELGCFTEKKGKRLEVKTKTWIEDSEGNLLFGKGKTEVLELIDETGSISGAAEKMGLNYKKTWSHIKTLQKNLDDEMVTSRQGGVGAGGTTLTDEAREYMKKYKILQDEIEAYANERFKEIFLKPRNKKE